VCSSCSRLWAWGAGLRNTPQDYTNPALFLFALLLHGEISGFPLLKVKVLSCYEQLFDPTDNVEIFMLSDGGGGFYFVLHFLPNKDIWKFLAMQLAFLWGQVENEVMTRCETHAGTPTKTERQQIMIQITSLKRRNMAVMEYHFYQI